MSGRKTAQDRGSISTRPQPRRPGTWRRGSCGVSPPGVGAGIGRAPQQAAQRFPMWSMPVQLPAVGTAGHTKGQIDLLLPQVAQQAAEAAQHGKLFEDQSEDTLHLLVGIELELGVRADHVARRHLTEPFAAAGAVQSSGLHTLLELMQLESSHEPLDGQDETIIEIMRMIQSVLISNQGVKSLANPDQSTAGFVLAGQAVDLEAEHDPDMAQGNLREQPGEIVAARGAGGRQSLITIEDVNALGGPAPSESELLEVGLDRCGFGVALDLLGMGLAHIDDGPAFQVMQSDLGGSVACLEFSGGHRPPPRRGVREDRGDAGATGSVASAGWPAVGVSARASAGWPGTTVWAWCAGGDWLVGAA